MGKPNVRSKACSKPPLTHGPTVTEKHTRAPRAQQQSPTSSTAAPSPALAASTPSSAGTRVRAWGNRLASTPTTNTASHSMPLAACTVDRTTGGGALGVLPVVAQGKTQVRSRVCARGSDGREACVDAYSELEGYPANTLCESPNPSLSAPQGYGSTERVR